MELAEPIFGELVGVIHRLTGLVIGRDKTYLVRHRLEPVVRTFGYDGFEAFLAALQKTADGRLHDAVIEAITTKETSFFRDGWLFEALQQRVLPELAGLLAGTRRQRLRLWSAAASTGQEAYSLAMLVSELAASPASSLPARQFSILASDISAEALRTARAGLYTPAELQRGISETRRRKHFHRAGAHWQVGDGVRELVQFRRLDLLGPTGDLGAFDLVLCRNVLIYFDAAARQRVCDTMDRVLMDGGYLVLGSAESLYGTTHRFETINEGRAVLYRKRGGG